MVNSRTRGVPSHVGWARDLPRWTPYAAVAWSLGYAALGLYWLVTGRGFPYAPGVSTGAMGPVAGGFGPSVACIFVFAEGIPAVIVAAGMLRGVRVLRSFLITAGALLAAILLLLMTDINLLIQLGYLPFGIVNLLTGAEFGQVYLKGLIKWTFVHEVLCLIGGFLWLAATVRYARLSEDACPYCGRRDRTEGWNSPDNAARWGRVAVYAALVVPVLYAVTRYAWALGIPLGMTEEALRQGQARGIWTSGLFLATFGLVGAALSLGLTQHWGEVFPRWMIGLAGRRVPIALAIVPASIVSVLLLIGGITVWSSFGQMADAATASGQDMGIVVGPVALFPVWGLSLGVATLGYYYRRRGPCSICGRGAPGEAAGPLANHIRPVAV